MRDESIFNRAVNRLHAISVMLFMLLCLSMPAQGKKTVIVTLSSTSGSSLKTLLFEYKDLSGYNYDNIPHWTDNQVLYTGENAPWSSYASSIGTVIFTPGFAEAQPTNMENWFADCENLTSIQGLNYLNTSKVTSMYGTFYQCTSLTSLDLSHFDTSNVTSFAYMFYKCSALKNVNLSSFNTSQSTNFANMFNHCYALEHLDLSNFNTRNSIDFSYMFQDCESLKSLDFKIDASNATSCIQMFFSCKSLKSLNMNDFKNTSKIKFMENMFEYCESLEQLVFPESFDTSNVQDMGSMFSGCTSLKTLKINHFNTENVLNMRGMFQYCGNLEKLDLRSFKTGKVRELTWMFHGCKKLKKLDLHTFDTRNVESMESMFKFCENLQTIISDKSWKIKGDSEDMFKYCYSLVGAIAYDSSKLTSEYANPDNGYFTKLNTYNVKICGESVTNGNCDDLSNIPGVRRLKNDGHIYFEPERYVLHLKGVRMDAVDKPCIEGNLSIVVEESDSYLNGSCTTPSLAKPVIKLTGRSADDECDLWGDGHLHVNGAGNGDYRVPGIVAQCYLSLSLTNLTISGTSYGICGATDRNTGSLYIWDQCYVDVDGQNGSICNFDELMIYSIIRVPEGAISDGHAVTLNGQVVKDRILIGPMIYPYGIFIAGVEVNSANCKDLSHINGVTVSEGGYLRYNLNTNTLEIDRADIYGGAKPAISNYNPGLTIKVGKGRSAGFNKLESTGNALEINAPTTIKGNPKLTMLEGSGGLQLKGSTAIAFNDDDSNLTIDNAFVNAIGSKYGICGQYFESGMDIADFYGRLTVKGISTVSAYGPSGCIRDLKSFKLQDNTIVSPKNANFTTAYQWGMPTWSGVCVNGNLVNDVAVIISYSNTADVNLDGEVNISDVVAVINTLAGNTTYKNTADVNSDKDVNISDVVMIINVMAGQ